MAETLLIVFAIFVVLGMPIGIALGVGTLATTMIYPALNPIIIPARFVGLLSDSFVLLSAPLFILAGNIAARGGIAQALIDLAMVLVGRFRGGLAYVNIVSAMFFGGISGSAVADVSALGTVLIPQMERKGYDRDFATVLTICAAILAPIIPPSIIAVIYAWMADESVAAIFAGGYLPGLLVAIGMAVPTFLIARKRNYPREPRPTLAIFGKATRNALPGLMIPLIIMGGILLGWFTPTEAAAVAVVYGLTIPPLFYKKLGGRDMPDIFIDSARLAGVIGLIIGLVGSFGWVLTYSKFPFRVAELIGTFAPTWWLFMIFVIVLYIFLGMAISGLPMEKLVKPLVPFLAAIIAVLLLVAFVPETVLFIPRLLGFVK